MDNQDRFYLQDVALLHSRMVKILLQVDEAEREQSRLVLELQKAKRGLKNLKRELQELAFIEERKGVLPERKLVK